MSAPGGQRIAAKPSGRKSHGRRVVADRVMTGLAVLATSAALVLMLFILGTIVWKGARSIHLGFFTHSAAPVGDSGGGMWNAVAGSLLLVGLGSLLGVPCGIGAGVYMAEFRRGTLLNSALRFLADVLSGVPSVVVGIVVYVWVVARQGHFSAFAGGVALALVMVPTIARTTDDMLRTVPVSLREAAWGLGVSRWRTVVSVSLRTALPGVVTGCLLAFARAAGEAAPLLFTAFGNQFFSVRPSEPIAALPLQIFVYALSPYEAWHRLAWAGALVLIAMIALALGLMRWFAARGRMASVVRAVVDSSLAREERGA